MKKVTFFDVEYANSRNKSICQIGIDCLNAETGDPYYIDQNIYVNPEDGFDEVCTKIHGITADRVKDAPNFKTVWGEIEKYFTNTVVIGHNVAAADINALIRCLSRYNIDIPEIYYIDTLSIARDVISYLEVDDYKLSTLCDYFNIDTGTSHDAFDDACACEDLYDALINKYDLNAEKYIKKYDLKETKEFIKYIADPVLRKNITEFYGMLRGFSIDNVITDEEASYIKSWRDQFEPYSYREEISKIIGSIDTALLDGVITEEEVTNIQGIVKNYLDMVNTAPSTLATQILNGILEGIVKDGEVSEVECKKLREWLYDNIYLSGHYPFDKIIQAVEDILADGIVTKEESNQLSKLINDLLNPVETLTSNINDVEGKHICLSGNFEYGSKQEVEKYIVERGGLIDNSVKKSTDILVVGNCECQSYSQGTFGTKVIKAMEYNEKGSNISIVKEKDLMEN